VLRKMCGPKRDEVTGEWRRLGKRGTLRSVGVFLTKYYRGDPIKKNEMGGACGKYGRQERCLQDFGWETSWKEVTCKTKAFVGG
jgi:hypothetical protein